MTNSRFFEIEQLDVLGFPWCAEVVYNEQVDSGRWVSIHEAILHDTTDDTYWKIQYQQGLTEYQELSYKDMFFNDPVQATQVELAKVTVDMWLPVES